MSNTLLPKRSAVASKVPTTAQLVANEIAVNTADRKIYIHNGAAVVQIGAGQLAGLSDVALSSLLVGQTLSWNGSAWVNASSGGGSGPTTALALPVTNASASTLAKGSPIYQSGVVAPYSYQVGLADANDLTHMPVLGLLSTDVAAGASGTVVVQGELQGLDTSAWSLRERLWVSPTGTLVNTIPTDSFAAVQVVAIVTRVHASQGALLVVASGEYATFRFMPTTGRWQGFNGTYWVDISIPRVGTAASPSPSFTPTSNVDDQFHITALANPLTLLADPNLPQNGQSYLLRIRDNGSARALTWTTTGAGCFRAVGVTLPQTTLAGGTLYVRCQFNSADNCWDVLEVAQQGASSTLAYGNLIATSLGFNLP